MKKIIIIFILITGAFSPFSLKKARAIECDYDLRSYPGNLIEKQFDRITLSVKVWDTGADDFYTISSSGSLATRFRIEHLKPGSDGWLPTQTITKPGLLKAGTHFFSIINERIGGEYCRIDYTVAPAPTPTSSFVNCRLEAKANNDKFTASSVITVKGTGLPSLVGGASYKLRVHSRDGRFNQLFKVISLSGDNFSQNIGSFNYNTYDVVLQVSKRGAYVDTPCQTQFTIDPSKGGAPTPLPTGGSITPAPPAKLEDVCKNVKELNACIECVRSHGAWTALGCIPTDFSSLLKNYIFKYGLGIAGGIAFLMILFGGFTVLISAGNPEQVAKGKEMITSALAGLLIIIFSVFILKLIGVEIFKIPGFQ